MTPSQGNVVPRRLTGPTCERAVASRLCMRAAAVYLCVLFVCGYTTLAHLSPCAALRRPATDAGPAQLAPPSDLTPTISTPCQGPLRRVQRRRGAGHTTRRRVGRPRSWPAWACPHPPGEHTPRLRACGTPSLPGALPPAPQSTATAE